MYWLDLKYLIVFFIGTLSGDLFIFPECNLFALLIVFFKSDPELIAVPDGVSVGCELYAVYPYQGGDSAKAFNLQGILVPPSGLINTTLPSESCNDNLFVWASPSFHVPAAM